MGLQVTEQAIKAFNDFKEKNKLDDSHYVRFQVQAGGCSGYSYHLGFVATEEYNEEKDDVVFEQDGLKIILDTKSKLFVENTTIGWYEDLNKQGFTFENPEATGGCGCGSSFSV